MKKIVFLLALILFICNPVMAQESKSSNPSVELPNIFIWAIPDENNDIEADKKNKKSDSVEDENTDVIELEEEPVVLNATTLKGYAEYVECAEDVLYMDDHKQFVINIKSPQKVAAETVIDKNKIVPDVKNIYSISKFKGEEYNISPRTKNFTQRDGNWSFGTSFDSEISTSQLENATSLFTKYDSKYFSLSSKYKKNNMTITQIQTDNFSVIPELKFNNIFAIQEVLSADMTRNRRSSELIFSINPLGNKDVDRMRFNVGAKQTYDVNTGNTWSQLNFTTNFKL